MSQLLHDTTQDDRMNRGGVVVDVEAIKHLVANVRGDVILPADATYDDARAVWNAGFDHHPALIVRCTNAHDVQAAVEFAREQRLLLSVRSGGHSTPGYGTNDGGVVIDLSSMKQITVDGERRTARIEPGLTSREIADTLHDYGLALTMGDTGGVGIGGLLPGGGIGWMIRSEGLTIDRLRAAEVVTADGQLLRASADEHPDLFWGIRGGGGNFGVVTAFEVEPHQGGTIFGGMIFYEATDTERILKDYVRIATEAPNELSTEVLLLLAPPVPFIPEEKHGVPVVAIIICYSGDLAEGERVVAPLRQLGPVISDMIGPMPYPTLFDLTDVGNVRLWQHHSLSQFFETLPDDMLHAMATSVHDVLSPETMVGFRVIGGAMNRVASDATAFAHRDKIGMVLVTHFGLPTLDAANLEARSRHVYTALQPYASGVYVNFLGNEGDARIREAYPPATYARLVEVKDTYDPTNLFKLNQNIKPTV